MKEQSKLPKNLEKIKTLGDLKESGYTARDIRTELRDNMMDYIRTGDTPFKGIYGYDDTVIPDIERAILSKHNINFLGLRGQAKTRIARMMINILDEYIPVIYGSELNDDPFNPISRFGLEAIEEKGDDTPITWMHRDERYTEKLATPDVSVADLIGDVDPIKAANLKLPYSDERVIHFGLVPRSHRGIFVINELPDLQARIQVALFNILQEGDIQIRGFKLRLPLDILFVFTANPEDYTNRGSIVTPLKDRIGSQIITHYPDSIEISKKITTQEANLSPEQKKIGVNGLLADLVEQIAVEARSSEYIDEKSGVSARLTISAYENLVSSVERRSLKNPSDPQTTRIADLIAVVPAITGKVELVYEGEQEGAGIVAQSLIGKAIRSQFVRYFEDPEKFRKDKTGANPYKTITDWFSNGNQVDVLIDMSDQEYRTALGKVPGLKELVKKFSKADQLLMMEFALHGLAEFSLLSKKQLVTGHSFGDLLSSMISFPDFDDDQFSDN